MIHGSLGDNKLSGTDGNDTLKGRVGNDIITGYSGADSLLGGTGDDTLIGSADNFTDTLVGGRGNDVYFLSVEADRSGNYSFQDLVVETDKGGIDTVFITKNATNSSVRYTLPQFVENMIVTDRGTSFTGIGNNLNNKLTGNYDAEHLLGKAGQDTLDGGINDAACDTLEGGKDDDLYYIRLSYPTNFKNTDIIIEQADEGTDTVILLGTTYVTDTYVLPDQVENLTISAEATGMGHYSEGKASGNALDNRMSGDAGNDTLSGQAGDDYLWGSLGNDYLRGDDGADTLLGAEGNDSLYGNGGADVLKGGVGNDSFYTDATDTALDTLIGGDGNDAYYLTSIAKIIEDTDGGNETVFYAGTDLYTLALNVEHLVLTGASDIGQSAAGNWQDNMLQGRDAASDSLNGGEGDDSIYAGSGNDLLMGGDGNDWLGTFLAWNRPGSGEWLDNYTADEAGDDVLLGGAGDDFLGGGTGSDRLDGGSGNDRLEERGDNSADTLIGGEGFDTVQLDLSSSSADLTLNFSGTQTILGKTLESFESLILKLGSGDYHITAGSGADTLISGSSAAWLNGAAGDDVIVAKTGSNTLLGGEGQDTLWFYLALDSESLTWTFDATQTTTLEGNTVSEFESVTLWLGLGDDSVVAGERDDFLSGGDGNDTVIGGGGNDTLMGSQRAYQHDHSTANGSDLLEGGAGDDMLGHYTLPWGDLSVLIEDTGIGADTLRGGDGNDDLFSGYDDDWLQGDDGNDTLNAGIGQDSLFGGAGDDVLLLNVLYQTSLSGSNTLGDTVLGGDGADRFVLTKFKDAYFYDLVYSQSYSQEWIGDFVSGVDTLEVSMSAPWLAIGNGDGQVDGALSVSAGSGFATTAELVIFTDSMSASASSCAAVAQHIGSASNAYQRGDSALFIVHDSQSSYVYRFESSNTNAQVEQAELTLLAVLDGNTATQITDYAFSA